MGTSKATVDLDNDNLKPKEATLSKSPLRNVRMNRRDSSTGTKESKDINDNEISSSENLVKYHIPSCDKSIQRKNAPKINSSKVRPMPKVGIKTAKTEDIEIAIEQAEKLESYNLSFESDKDLASLKDNEMYEEKRMAELVEFSTHSSSLNSELKALL